MKAKKKEHLCACTHPQGFHAKGVGLCRCGCERFKLRGRGVQIEIVRCIDPGDPGFTAPLFEVRCPPCGRIYQTRAYERQLVTRRSCQDCRRRCRSRGKRVDAGRTRPKDLPPAERYLHGSRARYVSGCRCAPCTEANREYARMRTKLPPNPLVPAGRARAHILKLRKRGIGRRTLADVAKVAITTVAELGAGRKTTLRKDTAERLLAAKFEDCVGDRHMVDAAPTQKLLAKLMEMGFTKTEIARRLGSTGKTPSLQMKASTITAANARKVARLYREFSRP